MRNETLNRRRFLKLSAMGLAALSMGARGLQAIFSDSRKALAIGFPNDAPSSLWKWAREADWYERSGTFVKCTLCPHECVLQENDRGFCRARVVKNDKLFSVVYGNPCAIHVDPIEKKPLFHFLPGSPILSVAMAGCNLRCLNCQNWEISQAKPETTQNFDLSCPELIQAAASKQIPSIAYTYTEPITFFEYVKDASTLGHQHKLRNVLVTAGYINEPPARELGRLVDAANIDIKAFNRFDCVKLTGSTLDPVLAATKALKDEGVWIELTRLIVPNYSDNLDDIRRMCAWIRETLGPFTPLHFSRFHSAYRLSSVPPTPPSSLEKAYKVAKDEGLAFVYLGNIDIGFGQDTICPKCGEKVIVRQGFEVIRNRLTGGKCPCGFQVPGIWK